MPLDEVSPDPYVRSHVTGLGAGGKACTAKSAQTIASQIPTGLRGYERWQYVRSGWLPGLVGSWATVRIPTGEVKTIPYWLTADQRTLVLQCPHTGELFNFALVSRPAQGTAALPTAGLPVGVGSFNPQDFTNLVTKDPDFKANWSLIEAQLRAENPGLTGAALDSVIYEGERHFYEAYDGLSSGYQVLPKAAAEAAMKYVHAAHTIAGAVDQVEGLIAAASVQGAPPAQIVQMSVGALVGLMAIAVPATAGVGAAIVAGIAAVGLIFQKIGWIGGNTGVQVCDGVTCDPPPKYVVNCFCFYDEPIPGGPAATSWRKFPDPSDKRWFHDSQGALQSRTRLIDVVFPEFHHFECEMTHLQPGAVGEFQAAFFSAWKANKEYALNGLKCREDWEVLTSLINVWNAAHDVGVPYTFTPSDRNLWLKSNVGVDRNNPLSNCPPPGPYTPYVNFLVTEMVNRNLPVTINTGARKDVKKTIVLKNFHPFPIPAPTTSTAATVAKVAVVGVGVTAAGIGIYAYFTKQAYTFVARRLYSATAGRAIDTGKQLGKKVIGSVHHGR